MTAVDYKKERENDVSEILKSAHPRKIIVSGPGTGKSHLFKKLIKDKKLRGENDFTAITFIGKLGDNLADDLCGLAPTYTMHGYARKLLLDNLNGWSYYPKIFAIIKDDLSKNGIKSFTVGDKNYKNLSMYYKCFGDDDVVYYALEFCRKNPTKAPKHDLILIDEFQDFNEVEAKFVDWLASQNNVVIVGDDDQALYGWKGASPDYIREKYDKKNTDFESHELRYCLRCTDVIIRTFHQAVKKYNLNAPAKKRIQKEYNYYPPDKHEDSTLNSQIHLITKCPPGMIAYKIKNELESITDHQKIKQVLIIGEGRSCKAILEDIAIQLINYGFRNVEHKKVNEIWDLKVEAIDAYKLIAKDQNSSIGWRILGNPSDKMKKGAHLKNTQTLGKIINGTPSTLNGIKTTDLKSLEKWIGSDVITNDEIRKKILYREIKRENVNLPRPLSRLDITVCNILNAKGLGADVVFVVGFDQKRLPLKDIPEDSEVYNFLVALTRAKKRVYFINTVGKPVSSFIDCVDKKDVSTEEVSIN